MGMQIRLWPPNEPGSPSRHPGLWCLEFDVAGAPGTTAIEGDADVMRQIASIITNLVSRIP